MSLAYSATTITSGYNPTQINANWTAINTALQDGLSRSGNTPNAMTANFDLGNQDLLNGGTINCADLIVAGSSVAASAAAAAASAAAASVSEANAATSETNAAASAAAAAASESSVAADAAAAAASEAAAAISETNADADAVATAADAVSTAADAAATAADAITTTADALSCFNDAASASTSAANAFTSETNAATSASNASTSETNAAASAAAALASELSAAAIVGGDQLTIGTGGTPPLSNKLELYDNSANAVYLRFSNTDTGTTSGDGFKLGINNSENVILWNYESTEILIATNATQRMGIASGGDVTVGATNRTGHRLILDGGGNDTYFQIMNTATGVTSSDGAVIGYPSGSGGFYVNNRENNPLYLGANNNSRFQLDNNGNILFYDGSTATKVWWNSIAAGWTPCAIGTRDSGALHEGTVFSINGAMSAGVWESVGPTGSGATNIWTAMDDIPSDARFAVIRSHQGLTSAAGADGSVTTFARQTGSAITGVRTNAHKTNAPSGTHDAETYVEFTVPLDSSERFDVTWTTAGSPGSAAAQIYFAGWK